MDTLTKVINRLKALQDRYNVMDETRDFIYWDDTPYQLTKPDGKTLLDDAISITPNSPKVLIHYIASDLMNGKWQTVVEGKGIDRKLKKSHYLESFLDDNLAQIDERAERRGETGLFDTQCKLICARGWIGEMYIAKIHDGKYSPECRSLDMRWTPFEFGNDGLNWVAPIYYRSRSEIESEYPEIKDNGDTDIVVVDYWDSEKNETWIGGTDLSTPKGRLARSQPNLLGYPPFVITIPPSGYGLQDKGYLKYRGDDILQLNKGLFKEEARLLSLEATAGYAGIYPGWEYEAQQMDSEPAKLPPKLDEVGKVLPGELHKPLPRGVINQGFITARQDVRKMLVEGGPISPKSYPTSPSGIAITTETELRRILWSAQVKGLQSNREGLLRMILDQFIRLNGEFSIGKKGKRNIYSASKMGNPDDYSITCELKTKSKRQEIANLALFTATAGHLPLSIRLKDILEAEDPDGIIKEMELEKARQADPALGLMEMALRYIEEADDIEDDNDANVKIIQAWMLKERAISIIKQRQLPPRQELPEKARVPEVEEVQPARNLLPAILGGGGAGGGRQPIEEE